MEEQKELNSQRVRWLFENHIEFLSTHRGRVTRLADAYTIESDRPEFTYAVLDRGSDPSLLEKITTVHLVPLSEPWDQNLSDSRYKPRGGLSYMTSEGDLATWKVNSQIEILRVSNEKEMDVFSHVQSAGFAQNQEDYDLWYPWLRLANQRNLENNQQSFYVGYVNGQPVGTTLIVKTKGLSGIYAVATLPEFRKQGVGSSLMARAILDAKERQDDQITLQVTQGSYAESLYKKLGFTTRFSSKIFNR